MGKKVRIVLVRSCYLKMVIVQLAETTLHKLCEVTFLIKKNNNKQTNMYMAMVKALFEN